MKSTLPEMLPNVMDLMLDAVFIVSREGRILYVNAASKRILGYSPEEMIGQIIYDFLWENEGTRTHEEVNRVMSGLLSVGFENRYRSRDGRPVNMMWATRWSEADQVRIGVGRDVTEKRVANEVRKATYAISEAAHTAEDLTALLNDIRRIVSDLVPVAGFSVAMRDEQTGEMHFLYEHALPDGSFPPSKQFMRELCRDVVASGEPVARADQRQACWLCLPLVINVKGAGALTVRNQTCAPYTQADRELLQFVSTQIAAVIERKQLHAKLLKMAQHDELTGLPNRYLLRDRMETVLARARRAGSCAALLYLDLDGFKQVNDSLGHAAGDLLLREVASRLLQSVREVDTVARLGGDEFVVVLEHVKRDADASAVKEKIFAAVMKSISIAGNKVHVQPSIGIALYPTDGENLDQLLQHADRAMYAVKKAGNQTVTAPAQLNVQTASLR